MLALLFDPRGRIESGPFLKAVLIILAVQWGLGLPGAIGAMAVVVLLLGLLSLPFTYAPICVWVKRLRGAARGARAGGCSPCFWRASSSARCWFCRSGLFSSF